MADQHSVLILESQQLRREGERVVAASRVAVLVSVELVALSSEAVSRSTAMRASIRASKARNPEFWG